jgi:hypothetical protein
MNKEKKLKLHRIGNRVSGLAMLTFGGIISFGTQGFGAEDIAGYMFIAEGLGDLISGDHHYVSSRIVKYISRGKIKINYDCNKYTN